MIERKKIFKIVVDKIDYDQFVELVSEHKIDYTALITDIEVFNKFYNKSIEFYIKLNKDAELYLDSDKYTGSFLTITVNLTTDNMFTQFLKGDLTKDEFKIKLKKRVAKYIADKLSETKQKMLQQYNLDLRSILEDYDDLVYLLDTDYFLDKVREDYRSALSNHNTKSKLFRYLKNYEDDFGVSYIIRINDLIDEFLILNFFKKQKNLIHKKNDTPYFNKEKDELFRYINSMPDQSLNICQYLLVVYGLYFKLFKQDELKVIAKHFDKNNQLYLYNKDNLSDLNTEFVHSLFKQNNIDLKLKKSIYYKSSVITNKNIIANFDFWKTDAITYLFQLIEDLMNSDLIIISERTLYKQIKGDLIYYINFLSNTSGYNKDELIDKINNCLTFHYDY